VRAGLGAPRAVARFLAAGLPWVVGCSGTLDAGSDRDVETLPVGPDNPLIVCNDGSRDNWQAEYALLLARAGGPELLGIVVSAAGMWFNLDENFAGFQELATSAQESGLGPAPALIRTEGATLVRPSDDDIDATVANDSAGARFIVETSRAVASPGRPVVVATGGRLTELADAYLIDPTVTERVVVMSSLGGGLSADEGVARMNIPNGELDPWADAIVAQRFRYVQVSAYYDHAADVPAERLSELPDNAFGDWMRAKQPNILATRLASDQGAVIALGVPAFTRAIARVSFSGWDGDVPLLKADPGGNAWMVTESDGAAATERLWEILLDAETFGP
jgi:hypothetical protein